MANANETRRTPRYERCPICGEQLPEAQRDRFVSYTGTVVCSGDCASKADDLPAEAR